MAVWPAVPVESLVRVPRAASASTSLAGAGVVVQFRDDTDPAPRGPVHDQAVARDRVTLGRCCQRDRATPDNPAFQPRRMRPENGELRVVAEFLEVVG